MSEAPLHFCGVGFRDWDVAPLQLFGALDVESDSAQSPVGGDPHEKSSLFVWASANTRLYWEDVIKRRGDRARRPANATRSPLRLTTSPEYILVFVRVVAVCMCLW